MEQHDLTKPFKCEMGDASFDSEEELNEHKAQVHMAQMGDPSDRMGSGSHSGEAPEDHAKHSGSM